MEQKRRFLKGTDMEKFEKCGGNGENERLSFERNEELAELWKCHPLEYCIQIQLQRFQGFFITGT